MNDTFIIGGGEAVTQVVESSHDTFDSAKFTNWLINAAGAGLFGLLLGGVIVGVLHMVPGKKTAH